MESAPDITGHLRAIPSSRHIVKDGQHEAHEKQRRDLATQTTPPKDKDLAWVLESEFGIPSSGPVPLQSYLGSNEADPTGGGSSSSSTGLVTESGIEANSLASEKSRIIDLGSRTDVVNKLLRGVADSTLGSETV